MLAEPLPARTTPGMSPSLSSVPSSSARIGPGGSSKSSDIHSSSALKNIENWRLSSEDRACKCPALLEIKHFPHPIGDRSELITFRSMKKGILGKITRVSS